MQVGVFLMWLLFNHGPLNLLLNQLTWVPFLFLFFYNFCCLICFYVLFNFTFVVWCPCFLTCKTYMLSSQLVSAHSWVLWSLLSLWLLIILSSEPFKNSPHQISSDERFNTKCCKLPQWLFPINLPPTEKIYCNMLDPMFRNSQVPNRSIDRQAWSLILHTLQRSHYKSSIGHKYSNLVVIFWACLFCSLSDIIGYLVYVCHNDVTPVQLD